MAFIFPFSWECYHLQETSIQGLLSMKYPLNIPWSMPLNQLNILFQHLWWFNIWGFPSMGDPKSSWMVFIFGTSQNNTWMICNHSSRITHSRLNPFNYVHIYIYNITIVIGPPYHHRFPGLRYHGYTVLPFIKVTSGLDFDFFGDSKQQSVQISVLFVSKIRD